MILEIDDTHRITSNEYSWDLEELTGKKPRWRKVGYYTSLGSALQEAARREIRMTDTVGLAECIEAASAIQRKYTTIFDQIGPGQAKE